MGSIKDGMANKILILGGTGAMGKHLVDLLDGTDNEVVVTSRSTRQSRNNIRYVQGNAHDVNFVVPLLQDGVDVVVNFMVYNTQEFSNVVDTFLSHCKQYIHLSSARVYSDVDDVITENTPRLLDICKDEEYLATDEYALTKARQENILFASGRRNYTIVRPYITYSEKRLQLGVNEKESWLFRALKGHSIVFSEDIASKYTTLTYGLDVARGIVALIGREEALGEAFHITADESIRWAEVLALYLDVLERVIGKRPNVCMQKFSPNLIGGGKWQVKCDRWYNRKFDNSKFKRILDTQNFIPPQEGLRNCLEHFLGDPKFTHINWKNEAKLDRISTQIYHPILINGGIKQIGKYYIFRFVMRNE